MPAGYYSDDDYVSEEDEKDDVPLQSLPRSKETRQCQGVLPPPCSQNTSQQCSTNGASKMRAPFSWSRNTCALRAPGTDPMKYQNERAKSTEAWSDVNSDGKSDARNPGVKDYGASKSGLEDDTPFGVPRRSHEKQKKETVSSAWVEQVLKGKSGESVAPRGSPEVRL